MLKSRLAANVDAGVKGAKADFIKAIAETAAAFADTTTAVKIKNSHLEKNDQFTAAPALADNVNTDLFYAASVGNAQCGAKNFIHTAGLMLDNSAASSDGLVGITNPGPVVARRASSLHLLITIIPFMGIMLMTIIIIKGHII